MKTNNRTFRRIATGTALVATAALALAGCASGGDANGGGESGGGEKITVGFTSPIAANSYVTAITEAAQAVIEGAGGEFILRDANLDPNQQVTDIEFFISQGVDAIIVEMPPVYEAIQPSLQAAHDAGIAIIAHNVDMDYEANAPEAPMDAQVIDNRIEAAKLQFEYIAEHVPDGGKILFVGGPAPSPAIVSSEDEFVKLVEESENFELYDLVNNMTDDISGAQPLVAAALAADPGIVAIAAYNDPSAVGAAQAGLDANRDLVIVGLQAQPEGVDAIKAGTLAATVDLHIIESGALLGELALGSLNGGTEWRKNYLIAPTLFDATNIDDFVSWDEQLAALR